MICLRIIIIASRKVDQYHSHAGWGSFVQCFLSFIDFDPLVVLLLRLPPFSMFFQFQLDDFNFRFLLLSLSLSVSLPLSRSDHPKPRRRPRVPSSLATIPIRKPPERQKPRRRPRVPNSHNQRSFQSSFYKTLRTRRIKVEKTSRQRSSTVVTRNGRSQKSKALSKRSNPKGWRRWSRAALFNKLTNCRHQCVLHLN